MICNFLCKWNKNYVVFDFIEACINKSTLYYLAPSVNKNVNYISRQNYAIAFVRELNTEQ